MVWSNGNRSNPICHKSPATPVYGYFAAGDVIVGIGPQTMSPKATMTQDVLTRAVQMDPVSYSGGCGESRQSRRPRRESGVPMDADDRRRIRDRRGGTSPAVTDDKLVLSISGKV